MVVNGELRKMWEGEVMACFKFKVQGAAEKRAIIK
jgi:hypothetical protein